MNNGPPNSDNIVYSSVPAGPPVEVNEYPNLNDIQIQIPVQPQNIIERDGLIINSNPQPQPQPERIYLYDPSTLVHLEKTRIKNIKKDHLFPSIPSRVAILSLIMNIFFPGVGTMIIGCHCNESAYFILTGLCQMCLSIILCGWIWAIITGSRAIKHSY
jgi:hypothetical protein